MGRHWLVGTFNLNQLRVAEHRRAIDEPRGGRAEHHTTRRCHRFHALRHADLLTDGGVTEGSRADLAGDHLTGVSPPATAAPRRGALGRRRRAASLPPERPRRQTGSKSVILQRYRRAEDCHDAVTGELVHRAAETLHHAAHRSASSAMISRSRSGLTAAAMSIECTTSANNTVPACTPRLWQLRKRQCRTHCRTSSSVAARFACSARQPSRGHGIASAHAICPSKPSVLAMSR